MRRIPRFLGDGVGRRSAVAARLIVITVGVGALVGALVAAPVPPFVAAGAAGRPAGATEWLCRPGLPDDPCTSPLSTTFVTASGAQTVRTIRPATSSAFDCFYIYPTVSSQPTANANLQIQPAEIGAAIAQASQFSQLCQIWAPMYRQRTASSLAAGLGSNPRADTIAYDSALAAFRDYMAHDNHGRPIIFIGHSQGAAMLIRLIHNVVDPNPRLRSQLVSALILGGNVQVPTGRLVGGSFAHIPACVRQGQTGCVSAYSTFPGLPPGNSNFGRPGTGVSLQSNQHAKVGQSVLCTNPARLGGGAASLLPYFLTSTSSTPGVKVNTPWTSYPNLYTAACTTVGGATWLQVSTASAAHDPRPRVTETLGPTWGYHLDDVNLALGNLLPDVQRQESSYSVRHRR
jgi:hypothetical protein